MSERWLTGTDAAYQSWLRRKIARLILRQQDRRRLVEMQKRDLDAVVEKAQREIENLQAQLTIGVAK